MRLRFLRDCGYFKAGQVYDIDRQSVVSNLIMSETAEMELQMDYAPEFASKAVSVENKVPEVIENKVPEVKANGNKSLSAEPRKRKARAKPAKSGEGLLSNGETN